MSPESMINQLESMRGYYNSGATRSYAFRRQQLRKLKSLLLQYENELYSALYSDLKKSPEESWITETGFLISEINSALKNLKRWMKTEKVKTNLVNFPSSSYLMREPLGVVLVIAPWNFPLQLLFAPLVGAIAAGNCVVLKPSEFSPATDVVMQKIIDENFSKQYLLYLQGEGSRLVPPMMSNFRFDHVFFTGSNAVGRIIYKMAADQLVPVTLELGGKSPCVIEKDADIKVAARRIAVGKFSNAGQMCVAPDYVLVHNNVKDEFITALKKTIISFYSENPSSDYSYTKIVNEKHFTRLVSYLSEGTIVHGGNHDFSKLYIEPTVIYNVSLNSRLMKEEIFGPILPIIPFQDIEEAKAIISLNPDPLTFYIYTANRQKEREWLQSIPAGGTCVNNSSWQFVNYHLRFGGRGNSGMGAYHGRNSFETFSHRKAVMKTPTWFDPDLKYPPFKGKLWLFRKVIR